jgi:hypothetical protein
MDNRMVNLVNVTPAIVKLFDLVSVYVYSEDVHARPSELQ